MRSCKAKRKRGLFIMAKIDNHVSIRLLILLILLHLPSVICETPIYSDCDVDIYYNSISTSHATNEEIGRLLKSTHRRVLPYTGSAEDTWDALADLDTGSQYNTVRLIYTETQAIAFPSLGNAKTWNREHLWPKSLGVGYSGADFTDIHHLRPADINVNSARGNKHFSDCGVVSAMEYCRSPAHAEAAASTATDYDVWLPPKNVRGDIARALFYMEHRYFGDNGDPNLELTDCPTPDESDSTKLAYLSQLLQWHIEDPVDEAEATRNQRACERWQGNRNIFVDFPDLVNKIYGAPQFPIGSNGYQCSNSGGSTLPPTYLPSDSMNNCTNLKAGAVQVIGIHSDSPDEVALVALEDLPGGMELFLTDNAWTGSGFRGYEGTAKLTVPSNGISKGSTFGFGVESNLFLANSWTQTGSLALSTSGDSIIVYCKPLDSSYNFLAAVTFDGAWIGTQFDSNNSGLPPDLKGANTALAHRDNYMYTGSREGTKEDLVSAIAKSSNWIGSNSVQSYEYQSFSVSSEIVSCQDLSTGDIQLIGIHSDSPDEIALVALEDIPSGLEIFLTDDGWIGSGFRETEGTAKLSVPSDGISKGTVFGFGQESALFYSRSWLQSGSLALSTSGDSVIVYCKQNDSSFNFLAAVTYDGAWKDSEFNSNNSDLPSSLKDVNTALTHRDNYKYVGPTEGSKNFLLAAIHDSSNWNGSNSGLNLDFETFDVYTLTSKRNESDFPNGEDSSANSWTTGTFVAFATIYTMIQASY